MDILGNPTGMYFHIIENGEIEYQGQIIRSADGWYCAVLFNWITGGWDGKERFYKIEDMKNWKFYNTGKEMTSAYDRASGEKEPEYYIRSNNQKKISNPAGLSLRYKILSRDNHTCKSCGRSIDDGVKLEVDHIYPKSKGGKNNVDNLQTLCFDCNRGKRDKVLNADSQ